MHFVTWAQWNDTFHSCLHFCYAPFLLMIKLGGKVDHIYWKCSLWKMQWCSLSFGTSMSPLTLHYIPFEQLGKLRPDSDNLFLSRLPSIVLSEAVQDSEVSCTASSLLTDIVKFKILCERWRKPRTSNLRHHICEETTKQQLSCYRRLPSNHLAPSRRILQGIVSSFILCSRTDLLDYRTS